MAELEKIADKPEAEILHGWQAIASHAGYSKRQVQNFVEKGLKVHKERRGGKNIVWANSSDIKEFVTAYMNPMEADLVIPTSQVGCSDDEVQAKASREGKAWLSRLQRHRWLQVILVSGLIGAIILFFLPDRYRTQKKPSEKPGIGFYQWEKNNEGYPLKVILYDTSGKRIRDLWKVRSATDPEELFHFENGGLVKQVAIREETRDRPGIALECLTGRVWIHTPEEKRPMKLPDLSIQTLEPENYEHIKQVVACYRIEVPFFSGWALLVQDPGLFPSCLLLLDENFLECGRLYHPGRMFGLIHRGESLYIATALNAREKENASYRRALFKVLLKNILRHTYQVSPFTSKTIPSQDRRNYYRFKGIPLCSPEVYLAFPPDSDLILFLSAKSDRIVMTKSIDKRFKLDLVFSLDLVLLAKWKQDEFYQGNFEDDYFATRFQYWEQDHWGPWQAERKP